MASLACPLHCVLCYFCLVLAVAVLKVKGACDYEALKGCIQPLIKYSERAKTENTISYTKNEFETVCSALDEVSACAKPVTDGCPHGDMWERVEESFKYMCGEGAQAYMQHQQCLGSTSLQESMKVCNRTLGLQASRLQRQLNKEERERQTCNMMKTFLVCMRNSVEQECGTEAADWQQTITTMVLQPMAPSEHCSLSGASHSWCQLSLLLLLTILLLHLL